jgi:hypothetical protein
MGEPESNINTVKNELTEEAGKDFTNSGEFSENLTDTLAFIDEFFKEYYQEDKKVPLSYLNISKIELSQQYNLFKSSIAQNEIIDNELLELLLLNIESFLNCKSRILSYSTIDYQRELLKTLLSSTALTSTQTLRELLYSVNYNSDLFISYECKNLSALIEPIAGKKDKINMLLLEQKFINQFPQKQTNGYSSTMPSVKEQINTWLNEEIKYLEKGSFADNDNALSTEKENKIHTSLSVAKLSLLIRLMVVDKIIINKQVAPMLKTAAAVFTTLQRERISPGSLETKYHAPDKATIKITREMLLKWVHLLERL